MQDTRKTLQRQWLIVQHLPTEPRYKSVRDLMLLLKSDGIEATERTIQRDLEQLQTVLPITRKEGSKPYKWMRTHAGRGFSTMSSANALALLLLRQFLHQLLPANIHDQLLPYFAEAQKTLEALKHDNPLSNWRNKIRVIAPTQTLTQPDFDVDVQRTLYEALLLNQQVLISYKRSGANQPSNFKIHLLGLVQRGSIIYLICKIEDSPKIYRLDLHRVKSAERLPENSTIPEKFDLDAYIAEGNLGFGEIVADQKVVLRFSAQSGSHLYETKLSDDQIIKQLEDGRLEVTVMLPINSQLKWWILGFGGGVEVVKPASLKKSIISSLQSALSLYQPK